MTADVLISRGHLRRDARSRFGRWLRRLAGRFDGGWSVTLYGSEDAVCHQVAAAAAQLVVYYANVEASAANELSKIVADHTTLDGRKPPAAKDGTDA